MNGGFFSRISCALFLNRCRDLCFCRGISNRFVIGALLFLAYCRDWTSGSRDPRSDFLF